MGINEGEGFECMCREGFKGKNCEGNLLFVLLICVDFFKYNGLFLSLLFLI